MSATFNPRLVVAISLLTGLLISTHAVADCSNEEVGYVASFQVKAGSESEFESAITQLAATVTAVESGVLLYAPYKGSEGQYFMMERYVNEAARAAHGKAPEVAALFPTLGPHLDGAPVVTPVSAVCP